MAGKMENFSDGEDVEDISDVEEILRQKNYLYYEKFDAVVKLGKTGVFWDAMDYPFPHGLSPDGIYHKIESALTDCYKDDDWDYMGEKSIWVYVDETKEPWCDINLKERTWKSRIYFLPGGDKSSGRRSRMLHDIHLWAMDFPVLYPRPSSLVVVSGQVRRDLYFLDRLEIFSFTFRVFLAASPENYGPDNEVEWPASLLDSDAIYSLSEKEEVWFNKPRKTKKHKPTLDGKDVEDLLGEKKCLRVEDFSTIVEGGQLGVFWHCLPKKNKDYFCTERQIMVFWNVMQCPIPSGATIPCVIDNIRSALRGMGFHKWASVYAYGDNLDQQDVFNEAVACLSLEVESRRSDRIAESEDYREMAVDLINFATPTYEAPAILVVIPKPGPDTELHRVLKCLETRNHEVLVVNPPAVGSGGCLESAKSLGDCIQGLDGGGPISISRPECNCDMWN